MDQERWRELCELAIRERDPNHLLELCQEMLDLLNQKYESLAKAKAMRIVN